MARRRRRHRRIVGRLALFLSRRSGLKPGEKPPEVIDVKGRQLGILAPVPWHTERLVCLGDYGNLIVFALLFGQCFSQVKSDLS